MQSVTPIFQSGQTNTQPALDNAETGTGAVLVAIVMLRLSH